jgi:tetratricopeptide (TPR) repeat protein
MKQTNGKPGRNDPCQCGSGRKFKHCCGRISFAPVATPVNMTQLGVLTQAGRYGELETQAREFILQHSDSGVAWQALGFALSMQGKDALNPLQMAAKLLPDDAGAHNNLGSALGRLGRLDEAIASYRRALVLDPDFAEAHNNLGNASLDLKRLDEAAASCRRALEIKPHFVQAHDSLGNALLDLGQIEQAAASFRRALEINPLYAEAHNHLGNALLALRQPQEALASYRRALGLRPDLAEAHNNLGNALLDLGRLDEARASYQRALAINPDFAEAHNNLGSLLRGFGQLDQAVACYLKALKLKPDFAEAHGNLGVAFRLQSRTADAAASCRRALEINPSLTAAVVALAETHADQGEFSEAEALFRRAASIERESPEAWAGISRLRKMSTGDTAWLAEAQRIADRPLPPQREVHLRYAMGKYFDDVGDFERAFINFQRANELRKLCRAPHDRRAVARAVDHIIRSYDRQWLSEAQMQGIASARPVFIVGMLRSGTTLAEQILASHPAVFGAGELAFWNTASATYKTPTAAKNARKIRELALDYLRSLEELSAAAPRVVDKMPANFLSLGLISAALPGARVIHMCRNPLDTCLSIYFQHFETTLSYANDLDDLAHYYTEYLRVMNHWRTTLPEGAILNVPYEELVEDPEAWSRKMLTFIGLPWDPRCTDFHLTNRTVITASKWQVRQKLSASSIGRWRHYEKFVGPLQKLLDSDA